ncbi:MAG TPA: hypothetical protein VHA75_08005 [Rugosimonospora sp.]|nr:hypothetical protein [Rugosimonospora sp.]
MSTLLCASTGCWRDADTGELRPRPAADGLRLCSRCARLLGEDVATLGTRYEELVVALTAPGKRAERVSSSREPGLSLNDAAVEARRHIRHELASLARLIAEERGVSLPEDRVPAIAAFVGTHAEWLAAHEAAGEFAAELRDLARATARIAYPSGGRRFPLTDPGGQLVRCPEPAGGGLADPDGTGQCPGVLWAVLPAAKPRAVVCNTDPEHTWPMTKWLALGARLVGARAA